MEMKLSDIWMVIIEISANTTIQKTQITLPSKTR
jgi:hypothetical protein